MRTAGYHLLLNVLSLVLVFACPPSIEILNRHAGPIEMMTHLYQQDHQGSSREELDCIVLFSAQWRPKNNPSQIVLTKWRAEPRQLFR